MTLLKVSDVSLAFGSMPLLDKVSWQIARGERVCIIGRNGTGKSSMLKLVKGIQKPDDGAVWRAPGLKIGELPQELPEADGRTVFDVVAEGLDGVGALLAEYHHLSQNIVTAEDLDKLMHVQQDLEARDGWRLQQLVDSTLSRLQLPADKTLAELSGGWRRRVLLAQALVSEPDLLLLDEPTNHLDIGAIAWLEEALLGFQGAVLFITHDRAFLQNLATRILELDRGGLIDVEFAVQYLVLGYSHQFRELTGNLGNIALLHIAADLGLIPSALADRVRDAYRHYRRLQHTLRLDDGERCVAPESVSEQISAVTALWQQVFG